MSFRLGFAICALSLTVWLGCSGKPTTETPGTGDHGHDHGHDHDHPEHGPHDGHLIELGEEEYHGEWTHDDESGLVQIFILDGAAKEEVAIAIDQIAIETKVEEEEPKTHQLDPVNASGEPPMAAQFEIKDLPLLVLLKAAGKGGVTADLKVTIDGKEFTGEIKHEEHGHHHH